MTSYSILDNNEKIKKLRWKLLKILRKNGTFAPKEQNAPFFHNIFKYMRFQRCQKGFIWSKRVMLKELQVYLHMTKKRLFHVHTDIL